MNKPKVFLFIRSLEKGGAEKQAILLTKLLSDSFQTALIVLYPNGDLLGYAEKSLTQDQLYLISNNTLLGKLFEFYKLLKEEKPKYLLTYLPSNNIFGILLGKFTGIKYIIGGIRGSRITPNSPKMYLQKILFNKLATKIISNSHLGKKTFSEYGVNSKKIHVVHNAIDKQLGSFNRIEKKVINILSVGRFTFEKDYDTALKAILWLHNNGFKGKFTYTIVGYGELENKIKEQISKYKLYDTVNLVINTNDINPLYESSDIFLMTSIYEGTPNVIMEAMNWSLPIIATNVGDIKYLVEDNVTGYICKPRDIRSITNNLIKLLDSYPMRLRMGILGNKVLKEKFSTEKLREGYVKIFNQLDN